jgi:hypothetical protein
MRNCMNYFVTFSFDIADMSKYNHKHINSELENLGLKNLIMLNKTDIQALPKFTYIGEYEYPSAEELKNILYTEIRKLFDSDSLSGTIFISVSENATIGVEVIGDEF